MADTAGRQMGLPLYAVLKGKTMNIMSLLNALPGAVAQGLVWGIMAIGVYITFRILDFADLTVDGSLCTGGAVCIMMMLKGQNVWLSRGLGDVYKRQVWQQAALPDFYIPLWGFRLSFPVSLHSWDYILLT